MSIVQGVGSFPFLSESVYRYITTGVAMGIAVEDVDVTVTHCALLLLSPLTPIQLHLYHLN